MTVGQYGQSQGQQTAVQRKKSEVAGLGGGGGGRVEQRRHTAPQSSANLVQF